MLISIVTVCHKSKNTIKDYVASFVRLDNKNENNFEFIFIENSGQTNIVSEFNPLIDAGHKVVIEHTENNGFGIACNKGAKIATGEVLLFVNPDVVFKSDLSGVNIFREKNSWGTVAQYMPNGKLYSIDLLPEFNNFILEIFKFKFTLNKYRNFFIKKCYVVGSFLAVNANLFKTVGGFDERFFLYYEETELCRRLQKIGLPVIVDEVSILHNAFGSHDTPYHALVNEASGFLMYCKITDQMEIYRARKNWFKIFSVVSKKMKIRYNLLKNIMD